MHRLGYAPPTTYLRQRSARPLGVFQVVAALALLAVFRWFFSRDDGDTPSQVRTGILWVLSALCAFALVPAAWFILRGGRWECRVEGGKLYLRTPWRRSYRLVDLSDVEQFVHRTVTLGDRSHSVEYELKLKDGQVVKVEPRQFGRVRPFEKALLKENPAIRVVKVKGPRSSGRRPSRGNSRAGAGTPEGEANDGTAVPTVPRRHQRAG